MNRRQFVDTLGQSSLAALIGCSARPLFGQSGHELPVNCAPPTHGAPKHITFNSQPPQIPPRKSVWVFQVAAKSRACKRPIRRCET